MLENKVALLRPEKAFTEEASEVITADEAAAKAAGATTVDAATMEAIAHSLRANDVMMAHHGRTNAAGYDTRQSCRETLLCRN